MDLHFFGLVLEVGTALLAFLAGRRRSYMYGLAVAFGIYAYIDASNLYNLPAFTGQALEFALFAATLAAFYTVWNLYRRR